MNSKQVFWRFGSILFLGIGLNYTVNWFFNFRSPIDTFLISEYLAAIVTAGIVLETIRYVNRRLKFKEFGLIQIIKTLAIDVILVMLILDVVGTVYMLNVYGDTYSLEEYFVINLLTISFTTLIVLVEQLMSSKAQNEVKDKPIEVSYLNSTKWIKPDTIAFIYVENGLTFLVDGEKRYTSNRSLGELILKLPEKDFFRANRQLIVSRSIIDETKSSSYGKIELNLKQNQFLSDQLTISRKQASAFRKWLKMA
ncbi:MAG: LytTR family DNA-binding domain-containing protein [Cyclobacteriaceae bacterium]